MNAPLSRPKSDLRRALKTRIDQHFSESGRDPRGGRALHAKAVILLGWAAISDRFCHHPTYARPRPRPWYCVGSATLSTAEVPHGPCFGMGYVH